MTEPDDARSRDAVAPSGLSPEPDRPSEVRLSTAITRDQLRAFLGAKGTQVIIRKAIAKRVRGPDAESVIDDVVQETFVAALQAWGIRATRRSTRSSSTRRAPMRRTPSWPRLAG